MKLTSREQEIVEVLTQDPLASQEDLAARFGISRSSVAVHISNLMKKGVILGKGYVFNKKVSAVVAGEILLRINISNNNNDCRIDTEISGFALEASQALVKLGLATKLLTVLGADELGAQILNRLKNQEVDVSNVIRSEQYRTARKVYVDNILRYSETMADEKISRDIESREWLMQNCEWLLIDGQFQKMLANKSFFRDENSPVTCTCNYWDGDLPEYLQQYHLLVLGVTNFQKLEQRQQIGLEMVQAGVENLLMTDGNSMILWFSKNGIQDFTLPPNQSFDSKNELHLFLAGLVYGLAAGYPMRQAIRIATAQASKNEP
ncbi:MAG: winged helix-turn-helix transcriptional regulator [Syntrophomonadaceae bacterium]|nr:winged helix-turn-helix transcriptional regulator [Syntrophomonadaceae bacterium]